MVRLSIAENEMIIIIRIETHIKCRFYILLSRLAEKKVLDSDPFTKISRCVVVSGCINVAAIFTEDEEVLTVGRMRSSFLSQASRCCGLFR